MEKQQGCFINTMRIAETTKPSLGGLCFSARLTSASASNEHRANEVCGVGVLPVGHFVSPVDQRLVQTAALCQCLWGEACREKLETALRNTKLLQQLRIQDPKPIRSNARPFSCLAAIANAC